LSNFFHKFVLIKLLSENSTFSNPLQFLLEVKFGRVENPPHSKNIRTFYLHILKLLGKMRIRIKIGLFSSEGAKQVLDYIIIP